MEVKEQKNKRTKRTKQNQTKNGHVKFNINFFLGCVDMVFFQWVFE